MSNEAIKKAQQKLDEHRAEAHITCEETCWCWEMESLLVLLESPPEPGELTKIIAALTNGVGEKPYCRRVAGQMVVFVADDQEFCRVALIDDYDEEIAQAICEAGLLIYKLHTQLEFQPEPGECRADKEGYCGYSQETMDAICKERDRLTAKDRVTEANLRNMDADNQVLQHNVNRLTAQVKSQRANSKSSIVNSQSKGGD